MGGKPVVLVVLDGWGIEEAHEHNGIHLAQTLNFDHLWEKYPHTTLHTSGEHVGLPEGQMGNSEVGHTTIGAGTVIYQDLVRITKDASTGSFLQNSAFAEAFAHVKKNASQLHIIGLLSPGGVHAHENHFFEIMRMAHQKDIKQIVLHPILDGRDSAPTVGINSLAQLDSQCREIGNCVIASFSGRYFAMDRDKNWDRTEKAFQAIWHGEAEQTFTDPNSIEVAVIRNYTSQIYDEHIEPHVYQDANGSPYRVKKNDAIIFTNFRTDRAKQLSQRIMEHVVDNNLCFVTMTDYGKDISSVIAYEPETIEHTLASAVSNAGLKQAHIAETEKYPHATYFFNGGKEEPHPGEEQILIPSRKDIKTHDEAPEMMAKEITDAALERLENNNFLFINYANADMVGHTAKKEAIITAVETVDSQLKRLTEAILAKDGVVLVIADHGNAERMVDPETSQPHTAHTTNVVPCILVSHTHKNISLLDGGGLKDVAPTTLDLLQLPKPRSMTGISLIKHK